MKKPEFLYGWYLVAASWATIFLAGSIAVSVFFKPMLEEFGWDRAKLSSVQSVAMIAFTILSPFLGRLIDRFGPRAMMLASVVTQVLCRLFNGLATNIWHLYLARLLFGINAMPSTQVLISNWFIKKRGIALGIVASGTAIGMLILPPISQYLILTWGWRPTMLFWGAVSLAIMLPLALTIQNRPEEKGYRPDGEPPDSAEPAESPSGTDPEAGPAARPDISLFQAAKLAPFWLLSISHIICGIGCGFMTTHTVIFATDMGYSEMIGASLVSVQGGLNLFGVLATGMLSDRTLRKNVLALTHFIRSLSFVTTVVFVLLGGGSLWLLYIAMALFGFGFFTTAPLAAGLIADLFGNQRMGTIFGVVISFHMLGVAAGAYMGGAIFEMTRSYYQMFLLQSGLEFLAAILAFSIRKRGTLLED